MSAKSSRTIRRRKYFIKKRFQVNFFIRFAILIVMEALLIAGIFIYLSSGTLTTGYSNYQLRIEKTSSFFSTTFLIIALSVGLIVSLAGMITFMFFSHRLAGPIYRFEKSLKYTSKGDLTHRIKLRGTDQLTDLQEAVNVFINTMDINISAFKAEVNDIGKLISRAENNQPALNDIKERLNKLNDMLKSFKTSNTEKK